MDIPSYGCLYKSHKCILFLLMSDWNPSIKNLLDSLLTPYFCSSRHFTPTTITNHSVCRDYFLLHSDTGGDLILFICPPNENPCFKDMQKCRWPNFILIKLLVFLSCPSIKTVGETTWDLGCLWQTGYWRYSLTPHILIIPHWQMMPNKAKARALDTSSRIQSSHLRCVEMYHAYSGGAGVFLPYLLSATWCYTWCYTNAALQQPLREMYWLSSIFYHHIGHHFEIKI